MTNISHLLNNFKTFGLDTALIWNDKPFSYAWLADNVDRWAKNLAAKKIACGETVAFSGDYSPETISLLLALVANKNIVVPLPPTLKKGDEEFFKITNTRSLFTVKDKGSFIFKDINKRNKPHHFISKLRSKGKTGLVLFSSGSTGAPKAILHDLEKLLAKYDGKGKKLVTVPFLFLDHIGGLNTLFYTLTNGGTLVIIGDRNPNEVCRAIDRHRVELLPTSPTFLNLLLISEAHKFHDLSSLRIISYGTEVMSERVLGRLGELFPKARLIQTYGLSELGILSSKSRNSSSLWMKVGGDGYRTKIVNGELWIKSDFSMVGYLNASSPFNEAGWFNTGDLVEKDRNGYLRIIGRHADIINVGGQKVNPVEVEDVIMKIKDVGDVTVFGEKNSILGNIVTAEISLKKPNEGNIADLRQRIKAFCKDRLPLYKVPARIIFADNSKVSPRFKKVRSQRCKI